MLVSLDWIKEFTNLPQDLSANELGIKFTMACAEVEEVIEVGAFLEDISVAEITEITQHPEADKLNLVKFKVNESDFFQVVCGASNVKIGLKTPYAKLGTTLPNGLTLAPKKIRGILSEGMLCSEEELGLSESSSGIMELPSDAPLGVTMLEYFKETKDILLDIDNKSLTHRPDLWGHYGLAREFAAIFKNTLKVPYNLEWAKNLKSNFTNDKAPVEVSLDKDSAGIAYFGLSLSGVSIEPSPSWMQKRLKAVGMRPINNIVDISNYVMQELGIPLHIFDRNQIKGGKVEIKKLTSRETFTTLDESSREMLPEDTMIFDSERPLVIGGIMGGLNSGVTEKTTDIFIEVANWHAAEVRKTSTRLGLRTDSSQRYEKTLDSLLCERTMLRTLELVLEICPSAKVIGGLQYDGIDLSKAAPLKISLCADYINANLGVNLEVEQIIDILERLDFKVLASGNNLEVTVPSYRSTKDIDCNADIIEEIGRIIGYDNITSVSPLLEVAPARLTPAQELTRKVKDFMVYHGKSFEVMTYPMVGEKLLKKSSWPCMNEKLKLLNALSKDHDRMRGSLVPSLLEVAALNAKNFTEGRFFELGRSYLPAKEDFAKEEHQLGIVFFDKDKNCFMNLVNTVEKLIDSMNISADLVERHPKFKNNVIDEDWQGVHPYEFYNIRIMGKMDGVITSVHPSVLRSFKIKGNLSIAILNLTAFQNRLLKDKTKYRPLPKFPGSLFDYTVEVEADTPVKLVLDILKKVKIKEIISHKVVDIFTDSTGKKFLTMRTTFLNFDQTLEGEFLKKSEGNIISTLEKNGILLKKA